MCNNTKGNNNIKQFAFVLIALLTVLTAQGKQQYHFKHYNINNGLSQNTVLSIMQDNQGFMWYGTKDGLNRFDGKTFKNFRFSPDGDLKDNIFHNILQDKSGLIWAGTDDGIYIYNPSLENFRRFSLKSENNIGINGAINDMVMDKDGDIWISAYEKGVFHYQSKTQKLNHYPITFIDNSIRILSLCVGNDNSIWVIPYSHPLFKINKKQKKVEPFELQDDKHILFATEEVSATLAGNYNELIIGSSRQGLIKINTVNKTHEILLDKDQFGQPIFVRSVARIDNQTLWVGTESGIYIYNTETGDVKNLRHNNLIPHSLSDNAIYSIYKDNKEGIWVGSYFGGIDYYPKQYANFEVFYPLGNINSIKGNRVREFCAAPSGNIWIGTEDNGLNLFNPKTKMFLPLNKALQSLYTNIHALFSDNDYLWISTYSKGLNRYNLITGELTTFSPNSMPGSIDNNNAFAMCKDRQNNLWVGTLSSLNIFDYDTETFKQIAPLRGIAIQDIHEDIDGYIWIATFSRGIYRFNPLTEKWKIFTHDAAAPNSLPYDKTISIFEDSKNRLWITTQGGGFCLYHKDSQTFTTFNTSNGLSNNVVYQILEDNDGLLWLSTNSGLVQFDVKNKTFKNYTVENGLKTNQFNYKSSYKTTDGILYFGSIDGFVRFNPASFRSSDFIPPIVLTNLLINNSPVNIDGEKSPLKKSILYSDSLILPHNSNSISIKYAVLDYSEMNLNKIKYKLEGFDQDWISPNENQNIVYSNLEPGNYNLSIQFQTNENLTAKYAARNLFIKVKPPLTRTTWAFTLYVLLAMATIALLTQYLYKRSKQIQQQRKKAFEQKKERELYQSKIEFFTNVAHEIRTPLSLIKAPLDQILLSNSSPDINIKENLSIMSKNTDRLLNLTNQLLDFRKTEADAYRLNIGTHNVSELLQETFLRFTPLAKQNAIKFDMQLTNLAIVTQVDKDAFIKIISNLFNNAIKFCDSFAQVYVYTKSKNSKEQELHVVTENDGALITGSQEEKLFKPFVRINNEKTGTGIGLALSRSLSELHKGSLFFEEKDGFNRFHLILPICAAEEEEKRFKRKFKLDSPELLGKNNAQKHKHNEVLLLVDDDVDLLQFMSAYFSHYYQLITAKDGKDALQKLENNTVDIVVSDVMMPEMDGFEFTRQLKSNIQFSHIPVILLTAKVNIQSKVQGFDIGADAYIEKPFSVEVVLAQISNLLQSRRKLRETFVRQPFIGANSVAVTKSDKDFVEKLNKIVQENLSDPSFNIENFAEQLNMSRASFYRKIKAVLDLTPKEYIRVERLKYAAHLLKENNYKVNEICYMVGFNSPSYFSKCFQQQFGMLPKDFA